MLDNNQQPKIFDSKMILAVAIIGAFYLGWQKYLNKKYPQLNQKKPAATETLSTNPNQKDSPQTTAIAQGQKGTHNEAVAKSADQTPIVVDSNEPGEILNYENEKVKFQVSSNGMGILNYESKKYSDRNGKPVQITAENKPVLALYWGSNQKLVHFKVTQDQNNFVGQAQIGQEKIERILTYHPESYSFTDEIKISNPDRQIGEFSLTSEGIIDEHKSKSFLMPTYESQDLLAFSKGQKEHVSVTRASHSLDDQYKAVSLFSVGTQYFTMGVLDQSDILPDLTFKTDINTKEILHRLLYAIPGNPESSYKQSIFMGPKSSENLKAANAGFVDLMDYGVFSFIARPLLSVMKWFHSLVGNWGVAIILLTLLVRGVVLPFNLMSYKSMKGMQTIQPQLTALREKYKNDSVTLNREMMALMKQNNANPLAGCLPMVFQIPIFFALYRAIGYSAELYQAPFFGWIQDLSLHDKYYVLPVLMGVTMYIQQKLTPSTMDPTQAKLLAFMPVIFSVFMLNLPAGLTLYMCVSAIFGIIQQKTFMSLMKK